MNFETLLYEFKEYKYDKSKHVHKWGGYSRTNGQYYEGGHGKNTDEDEKKESGKYFKKKRGE